MGTKRICWALAVLALAGCADRMTDYPKLLPTDQLLAEPHLPAHASDAATSPQAVAASLSGRAAALSGRAASGPAADSGLTARADALRKRAAELSQRSLDECQPEQPECGAAPAQ